MLSMVDRETKDYYAKIPTTWKVDTVGKRTRKGRIGGFDSI